MTARAKLREIADALSKLALSPAITNEAACEAMATDAADLRALAARIDEEAARCLADEQEARDTNSPKDWAYSTVVAELLTRLDAPLGDGK